MDDATEWVDIMTLRPAPACDELRLATVKAEDVDAIIEFWRPVLEENSIWQRPSTQNGA